MVSYCPDAQKKWDLHFTVKALLVLLLWLHRAGRGTENVTLNVSWEHDTLIPNFDCNCVHSVKAIGKVHFYCKYTNRGKKKWGGGEEAFFQGRYIQVAYKLTNIYRPP